MYNNVKQNCIFFALNYYFIFDVRKITRFEDQGTVESKKSGSEIINMLPLLLPP